jgi:hypothetical protein
VLALLGSSDVKGGESLPSLNSVHAGMAGNIPSASSAWTHLDLRNTESSHFMNFSKGRR